MWRRAEERKEETTDVLKKLRDVLSILERKSIQEGETADQDLKTAQRICAKDILLDSNVVSTFSKQEAGWLYSKNYSKKNRKKKMTTKEEVKNRLWQTFLRSIKKKIFIMRRRWWSEEIFFQLMDHRRRLEMGSKNYSHLLLVRQEELIQLFFPGRRRIYWPPPS